MSNQDLLEEISNDINDEIGLYQKYIEKLNKLKEITIKACEMVKDIVESHGSSIAKTVTTLSFIPGECCRYNVVMILSSKIHTDLDFTKVYEECQYKVSSILMWSSHWSINVDL